MYYCIAQDLQAGRSFSDNFPVVINSQKNFFSEYCFHWVGQGLFCSGTVGDFNFIYDCGGERNLVIQAVERLSDRWEDRKHVNLLVLSHLHADHINGLDVLKSKGFSFDTVLIPYITKTQLIGYRLSFDQWEDQNKGSWDASLSSQYTKLFDEKLLSNPKEMLSPVVSCEGSVVFYDGLYGGEKLTDAGFQKKNNTYQLPVQKNPFVNLLFYQPGYGRYRATRGENIIKKFGNQKYLNLNPALLNELQKTNNYLNASSLVMMIAIDQKPNVFDLILTGDLPETKKKYKLTRLVPINSCKYFQIPHHGALAKEYSVTTAAESIISCGIDNRYDHPASKTIKAYMGKTISTRDNQKDYIVP